MKTTRRQFLTPKRPDPLLVVVYLRGGADGLALVPPYAEDRYYELRPTLAIPRPDAKDDDAALPLDERFGLHPSLAPLLPHYECGDLTVIHAVGSDDGTRSHFEAQDRMEHAGRAAGTIGSGWLARMLRMSQADRPLSAVAMGTRRPESLRGAPAVAVLSSADAYRLGSDRDAEAELGLATLYAAAGPDALVAAGQGALDTLRTVAGVDELGSDVEYPEHPFGRHLRELARLVTAGADIEVATVDLDGWDTHFVQASALASNAQTLAEGVAAFAEDLGDHWARTTVLVMTEFGRRAYESTSLGTDHGRAGAMFVFGGNLRGGNVVTDWPGLSDEDLEGPGDLRVTLDYRDVLVDVLRSRHRLGSAADVFPGHRARSLSVAG